MISIQEYSRHRKYNLQEHHDEGLMFQLSLGFARRKLAQCGIVLNICSSTYFLGVSESCVLMSAEHGFIDIFISAKQYTV